MPKDNAPQIDATNAATNPITGSTADSAPVTKDASTGGANTAGDGQNQEGTGGGGATDANAATDANVAGAGNAAATGDGGAKADSKDMSTPSQPTARKGTEKKSNFKSVGNNFYCRLRLYNGLKQGRFSVKERKTIYNPFKLGVCFKVSFSKVRMFSPVPPRQIEAGCKTTNSTNLYRRSLEAGGGGQLLCSAQLVRGYL